VIASRTASIQRTHLRRLNESKPTVLTTERIKKLDDIGFDWTVGEQRHVPWERRCKELEQFVVRSESRSDCYIVWIATARACFLTRVETFHEL
jgi:hypothetical protein